MPREFRPYTPDRTFLLPPSVREWLPEDHLAHFVSDTVDALDLSAFEARYGDQGPGNQAFDPRMMLKVLVYAYATGTFSSRKIAAKLREDVAYRVLAAENFPAHRTISDFRHRHLSEFRALFVQIVQIAREAGLVKLGTVAVDGSKVKANASKHKAMSYGRMKDEEKRLRKEIRALTEQARQVDAEEDRLYGRDRRGDELPAELARRESRLRTIRAARDRLEARQREQDKAQGRTPDDDPPAGGKRGRPFKRPFGEPPAKAQENFTDPDSRIMKCGSSGFEQCYNAQIAVDEEARIIVATHVTQSASDVHELIPILDQIESNLKQAPKKALADAGYRSESNLKTLEERKIAGYIALGRERDTKDLAAGPDAPATARMAKKMKSVRGRDTYRKRKFLGEPPFAWIKSAMGFGRFSLRSLLKVSCEWELTCLAVNLRRLHRTMEWV